MKQQLNYHQTLKQTFKFNQTMLRSLDFLKVDNNDLNKLINDALQSNPFLESHHYPLYQPDQFIENIVAKPSLQEELYHQLLTIPLNYQKEIMNYLIESLNEHGFLTYPKETYLESLNISKKEFDYHLHILQSLEPAGVGAEDTIDAICIQLNRQGKIKAEELIKRYRDTILSQNYSKIENKTKLTKKEIDNLFNDIRLCNPFPCSNFESTSNQEHCLPDVEILIEGNQITIQPINQPNLILNNKLYQLVRDNNQMQNFFKDAAFIIENLTKRNKTVLMITNQLVTIQKGYFLYHDELVPCTLSDLALACGFHESTVSRTLNQKYYIFNNEIYPLKTLLVSKTTSGDSSDSIKKAMIAIIENEDKKHPLSDEAIVDKLSQIDLYCSRRVISKYRNQLSIPASSKRRRK